jgi:hypothetical protein
MGTGTWNGRTRGAAVSAALLAASGLAACGGYGSKIYRDSGKPEERDQAMTAR